MRRSEEGMDVPGIEDPICEMVEKHAEACLREAQDRFGENVAAVMTVMTMLAFHSAVATGTLGAQVGVPYPELARRGRLLGDDVVVWFLRGANDVR